MDNNKCPQTEEEKQAVLQEKREQGWSEEGIASLDYCINMINKLRQLSRSEEYKNFMRGNPV